MDVASLKIEGASTIHPVRKGFLDLAQPSAPEIAGRFGAAGTDIHWQFGGVGIGALALRVIVYVCTRMFVSASVHVGVTKCGRKWRCVCVCVCVSHSAPKGFIFISFLVSRYLTVYML